MSTIFAFVKLFDNEDHAKAFVDGNLFMNTIRSFKEYKDESGELRGDKYEGVVALYQPSELGNIQLGDITIPASELAAPIVMHGNHLLDHNVFCIYSLNSRGHESVSSETIVDFKKTLDLHDSCFGLGKYCVVIHNVTEFISRCTLSIKEQDLDGTLGLVDYFDEHQFHGNMPEDKLGYQKRSLFAHQREYRIKIDTRRATPTSYILDVGDLNDIALITTTREFNAQLKIQLPDGSTA